MPDKLEIVKRLKRSIDTEMIPDFITKTFYHEGDEERFYRGIAEALKLENINIDNLKINGFRKSKYYYSEWYVMLNDDCNNYLIRMREDGHDFETNYPAKIVNVKKEKRNETITECVLIIYTIVLMFINFYNTFVLKNLWIYWLNMAFFGVGNILIGGVHQIRRKLKVPAMGNFLFSITYIFNRSNKAVVVPDLSYIQTAMYIIGLIVGYFVYVMPGDKRDFFLLNDEEGNKYVSSDVKKAKYTVIYTVKKKKNGINLQEETKSVDHCTSLRKALKIANSKIKEFADEYGDDNNQKATRYNMCAKMNWGKQVYGSAQIKTDF